MLRSNAPALRPCVRSSSWSRDRMRPGRSQKVCSKANSASVSATRALSGLLSSRKVRSIRQPRNVSTRAPIIVEAANAPTEPEADEIFDRRQITVVPDILVNAGGVTASWFEWVQNRQHYQWGINRVRQELDRILGEAFENVWQLASSRQVPLRTAAYMLGVGRVARATVLGGI